MSQPLDESYFKWLYRQVADENASDPSLTYWKLLKLLFTKEFVWLIPNDDNRLEDGKELRREFIQETGERPDRDWVELGCSVLELMVGLSRRLAFEAEGEPHYWFWHLMENVGLHQYSDSRRLYKHHIDDILERLIWRTYQADGQGGFFPLGRPNEDQRNVELWYQLSNYVNEMTD